MSGIGIRQYHRERLLEYASAITEDPTDPIAVRANALPLLQWLEGARDQEDMEARFKALTRQYLNIFRGKPSGDPAGFIADAEKYYAFLIG